MTNIVPVSDKVKLTTLLGLESQPVVIKIEINQSLSSDMKHDL